MFQKEEDEDDYFGDGPLGQKMPKPEPEPGEMVPEESLAPTGKKGKRKKKKKGLKSVSVNFFETIHKYLNDQILVILKLYNCLSIIQLLNTIASFLH